MNEISHKMTAPHIVTFTRKKYLLLAPHEKSKNFKGKECNLLNSIQNYSSTTWDITRTIHVFVIIMVSIENILLSRFINISNDNMRIYDSTIPVLKTIYLRRAKSVEYKSMTWLLAYPSHLEQLYCLFYDYQVFSCNKQQKQTKTCFQVLCVWHGITQPGRDRINGKSDGVIGTFKLFMFWLKGCLSICYNRAIWYRKSRFYLPIFLLINTLKLPSVCDHIDFIFFRTRHK